MQLTSTAHGLAAMIGIALQIRATCRRSLGDPEANAVADNDSSITMSARIVREVLLTTEWVLAGYAGDRRKW